MKRFIFAAIALSLVTLGLTACRNRITVVETASMVTHPALHKGDILIFDIPSPEKGPPISVQFFDTSSSPCEEDVITVEAGKTTQCKVTKNPTAATRYLYFIGPKAATKPPIGKCPPCWPGVVVVAPKSGSSKVSAVKVPRPTSPFPAAEILIYLDENGNPVANSTAVYQGQPVTWYKNGVDTIGWSVTLDPGLCGDATTVMSGHGELAYCYLNSTAPVGNHSYAITIPNVKSGPKSNLSVIEAPASSTPSNPQ